MTQRLTPHVTATPEGAARPVNLKDGDLATPVPLGDFMSELGVLLQLPRRQAARAAVVVLEQAPSRVRIGKRALVLPAVAAILAAATAYSRLSPAPPPPPIPVELRGEWRTGHPKYRDRQLSFTSDRVGLALREGVAPTLHPISAMTMRSHADTTQLAITYEEDGAPVEFRLNYVGGVRPQIQLSNPSEVTWEPVRAARMPVAAAGTGPAPAPSDVPAIGGRRPWDK